MGIMRMNKLQLNNCAVCPIITTFNLPGRSVGERRELCAALVLGNSAASLQETKEIIMIKLNAMKDSENDGGFDLC